MGKIARMSDTLASQVAAGEVIERPASVVKELIENSLDAGAKQIMVETQRGGVASLRVTDDGCGMSREDALMCLERHATSKLKSSKDLESMSTMGFRGEAIPSIASVGRFRLLTREKGSETGTELRVDGGEMGDVKEAGCAEGTVVEVRELFYNIPARRKFLKAESTESAHIEHQIRLQALAHPEVRFTLKRDGRVVFDLPAVNDPRMRVAALTGADLVRDLLEVPEHRHRGVTVKGFVLKAIHARAGRRHQFVFLNQRPIEDSSLSGALRDGFGSVVGKGLNPGAWLWLEVDPKDVDVNVHPAKREVRFQKIHEVREAVREAVEIALRPKVEVKEKTENAVIPVVSDRAQPKRAADVLAERLAPPSQEVSSKEVVESKEEEAPRAVAVQKELPKIDERVTAHSFKVIGPLREKYFVLEGDEGLVLLDPQAARERVIYEQILKSADGESVASQGLLVPILLELDSRDLDVVLRHADHFSSAGIEVEDFGKGTLQVRAIPSFLKDSDPKSLLMQMVDELVESGGVVRRQMSFEPFAARIAAVSARAEKWKSAQIDALLEALFECDLPFCGADGRPTLIQLSLQELDRRFGRK